MMHVVRTILLLLLPFLVQIPLLSSCYLLPYVRTYMFAYNIEFGMPVLSAKLDHNLIPNTSTGSTALLASYDILILYLGIKVTSFEFQLIQFSKNVEEKIFKENISSQISTTIDRNGREVSLNPSYLLQNLKLERVSQHS